MSNPGSKYVRALRPDPRVNNGTVAGGLAHVLQSGLHAYALRQAEEDAKEKQAGQRSMLADMLRGVNRDALSPKDESGAMGPTVEAAARSRIENPEGLAGLLMSDSPGARSVAMAQYERAMRDPEKPEAYTLSPGQARYVGGQKLAAVPAVEKERRIIKGVDDRQYYEDGTPVLPNVRPTQTKLTGFDEETKLRKAFTAETGDFVKVRDAFGRIAASAQDPSPAGDLALIFNFMKVLDPGSVVRESEYATAANAAGVPAQVRNMFNRIMDGERLAPQQRDDFVNRAGRLYESQQQFYSGLQSRYSGLAEAYGLDPSRVVYDMGAEAPARSVVPEIGVTARGQEPLQTEVFSFGSPDEVGVADFGSVKDFVSQATEADIEALPPEVYAALEARLRAGQ